MIVLKVRMAKRPEFEGGIMPEVIVYHPRNMFDLTDLDRFQRVIINATADNMDAVNPDTGEMTNFGSDPYSFIDLIMVQYDTPSSSVTSLCLAKITTFGWPDRVRNMPERLAAIAEAVRNYVPDHSRRSGQKLISFTFCRKETGDWLAI